MNGPASLLSIVTPAYRVEDYLPHCLDSILDDAPLTGVQVVVVNDGSPDGSGAVADRYANGDPRVRVSHLPTSVGPGRARNAGLDHARGEYVWFVDADDWLPAGSLSAVLSRLTATRPDALVVNHAKVFPDGRKATVTPPGMLRGISPPGPLTRYPRLLTLDHSACTKVVRRSFLDATGLRFSSGWYEDCAFSHLLLLAAGRIDALDRVCYYYRRRDEETITQSTSPRHFDVFEQYERVWDTVDRAGGAYEQFRPELFRLMINHLLVIIGNERRLPPMLRREFFRRMAQEYRRRLPLGGYDIPRGVDGLKHRLVHYDVYSAWSMLRLAWRTAHAARSDDRELCAGK